MIKNLFITTLCAVAFNMTYANDIKPDVIFEEKWDNTSATYTATDHINTFYDITGSHTFAGINIVNNTENLTFSGNSTIDFITTGIDTTTCDSMQVQIAFVSCNVTFDLSNVNKSAPVLDIDLSDFSKVCEWYDQNYFIYLEGSTFSLTGLENLAAGKYCLLNVTGAEYVELGRRNVGIGEGTDISIEQTATGYGFFYTHGQIPEPSTTTLGLFGLAALMMRRRRR